ncbi:EcsC family protein [Granulicoccus phenolivorans]|uniref:EcsC family protein n=1 Tax=Granulicoccus phenolivorans TaxID=266854 RepID=UPI00040D9282|nr:EcsC family protein [Granulicoccus phenolivorans]
MANNVNKMIADSLVPVAHLAPNASSRALRTILQVAIEGWKQLPGARVAAAQAMQKHGAAEPAIDSMVKQHVGLAGAQGFVTNIGGLITMIVGVPANLAGVTILQARLVASIAHLRGYDLNDQRVRTAIAMCMVGDDLAEALEEQGLPSSPLVIATAPVYDPMLDQKISDRVAAELVARMTGKGVAVAMSKRIPVLGGGIGAAVDSYDTHRVSRYARKNLPSRRTA